MTSKAKGNIEEKDVIIFRVDEWRDSRKTEFDGHVQFVKDDGVEVIYLSGYRSRNDFIPWVDIIAKLDMSKPWMPLAEAPFSGRFQVF